MPTASTGGTLSAAVSNFRLMNPHISADIDRYFQSMEERRMRIGKKFALVCGTFVIAISIFGQVFRVEAVSKSTSPKSNDRVCSFTEASAGSCDLW